MECVKRLLVADASQEFRCHLVESFQNDRTWRSLERRETAFSCWN